MNYAEAIEYILALPDMERFSSGSQGHTMTLETMKAILAVLRNPQNGRGTVHVTGSKGKGSTSTFIASILNAAALPTSLYTSPHLHDYTERIALNLKPVSQKEFALGLNTIRDTLDEINNSDLGPVSTFGAMTALFFHLSRKHQMQWQVVEVGLGGTTDGTNVFERKDAAVITPISLEHTAILGNTCAEIAAEKAGIITEGTTVVLAKQNDQEAKNVVAQRCAKLNAKLIDVDEHYHLTLVHHDGNQQSFRITSPNAQYSLESRLLGLHQLRNVATAIAVAENLRPHAQISDEAICEGIAAARIAGRLEQLASNPLIIADGAHNGESAKELASGVSHHFKFEHVHLVLGVNSDKQVEQILEALNTLQPLTVYATASGSQKALPTETLASRARAVGLEVHTFETVGKAVAEARDRAAAADLILITGSLYVVAEGREALQCSVPAT